MYTLKEKIALQSNMLKQSILYKYAMSGMLPFASLNDMQIHENELATNITFNIAFQHFLDNDRYLDNLIRERSNERQADPYFSICDGLSTIEDEEFTELDKITIINQASTLTLGITEDKQNAAFFSLQPRKEPIAEPLTGDDDHYVNNIENFDYWRDHALNKIINAGGNVIYILNNGKVYEFEEVQNTGVSVDKFIEIPDIDEDEHINHIVINEFRLTGYKPLSNAPSVIKQIYGCDYFLATSKRFMALFEQGGSEDWQINSAIEFKNTPVKANYVFAGFYNIDSNPVLIFVTEEENSRYRIFYISPDVFPSMYNDLLVREIEDIYLDGIGNNINDIFDTIFSITNVSDCTLMIGNSQFLRFTAFLNGFPSNIKYFEEENNGKFSNPQIHLKSKLDFPIATDKKLSPIIINKKLAPMLVPETELAESDVFSDNSNYKNIGNEEIFWNFSSDKVEGKYYKVEGKHYRYNGVVKEVMERSDGTEVIGDNEQVYSYDLTDQNRLKPSSIGDVLGCSPKTLLYKLADKSGVLCGIGSAIQYDFVSNTFVKVKEKRSGITSYLGDVWDTCQISNIDNICASVLETFGITDKDGAYDRYESYIFLNTDPENVSLKNALKAALGHPETEVSIYSSITKKEGASKKYGQLIVNNPGGSLPNTLQKLSDDHPGCTTIYQLRELAKLIDGVYNSDQPNPTSDPGTFNAEQFNYMYKVSSSIDNDAKVTACKPIIDEIRDDIDSILDTYGLSGVISESDITKVSKPTDTEPNLWIGDFFKYTIETKDDDVDVGSDVSQLVGTQIVDKIQSIIEPYNNSTVDSNSVSKDVFRNDIFESWVNHTALNKLANAAQRINMTHIFDEFNSDSSAGDTSRATAWSKLSSYLPKFKDNTGDRGSYNEYRDVCFGALTWPVVTQRWYDTEGHMVDNHEFGAETYAESGFPLKIVDPPSTTDSNWSNSNFDITRIYTKMTNVLVDWLNSAASRNIPIVFKDSTGSTKNYVLRMKTIPTSKKETRYPTFACGGVYERQAINLIHDQRIKDTITIPKFNPANHYVVGDIVNITNNGSTEAYKCIKDYNGATTNLNKYFKLIEVFHPGEQYQSGDIVKRGSSVYSICIVDKYTGDKYDENAFRQIREYNTASATYKLPSGEDATGFPENDTLPDLSFIYRKNETLSDSNDWRYGFPEWGGSNTEDVHFYKKTMDGNTATYTKYDCAKAIGDADFIIIWFNCPRPWIPISKLKYDFIRWFDKYNYGDNQFRNIFASIFNNLPGEIGVLDSNGVPSFGSFYTIDEVVKASGKCEDKVTYYQDLECTIKIPSESLTPGETDVSGYYTIEGENITVTDRYLAENLFDGFCEYVSPQIQSMMNTYLSDYYRCLVYRCERYLMGFSGADLPGDFGTGKYPSSSPTYPKLWFGGNQHLNSSGIGIPPTEQSSLTVEDLETKYNEGNMPDQMNKILTLLGYDNTKQNYTIGVPSVSFIKATSSSEPDTMNIKYAVDIKVSVSESWLYSEFSPNIEYLIGSRVTYDGTLYKRMRDTKPTEGTWEEIGEDFDERGADKRSMSLNANLNHSFNIRLTGGSCNITFELDSQQQYEDEPHTVYPAEDYNATDTDPKYLQPGDKVSIAEGDITVWGLQGEKDERRINLTKVLSLIKSDEVKEKIDQCLSNGTVSDLFVCSTTSGKDGYNDPGDNYVNCQILEYINDTAHVIGSPTDEEQYQVKLLNDLSLSFTLYYETKTNDNDINLIKPDNLKSDNWSTFGLKNILQIYRDNQLSSADISLDDFPALVKTKVNHDIDSLKKDIIIPDKYSLVVPCTFSSTFTPKDQGDLLEPVAKLGKEDSLYSAIQAEARSIINRSLHSRTNLVYNGLVGSEKLLGRLPNTQSGTELTKTINTKILNLINNLFKNGSYAQFSYFEEQFPDALYHISSLDGDRYIGVDNQKVIIVDEEKLIDIIQKNSYDTSREEDFIEQLAEVGGIETKALPAKLSSYHPATTSAQEFVYMLNKPGHGLPDNDIQYPFIFTEDIGLLFTFIDSSGNYKSIDHLVYMKKASKVLLSVDGSNNIYQFTISKKNLIDGFIITLKESLAEAVYRTLYSGNPDVKIDIMLLDDRFFDSNRVVFNPTKYYLGQQWDNKYRLLVVFKNSNNDSEFTEENVEYFTFTSKFESVPAQTLTLSNMFSDVNLSAAYYQFLGSKITDIYSDGDQAFVFSDGQITQFAEGYSEPTGKSPNQLVPKLLTTSDEIYTHYFLDSDNILNCVSVPDGMEDLYPLCKIRLYEYIPALLSATNRPEIHDIDMLSWSSNKAYSYIVVYTNLGVYLIDTRLEAKRLKYDYDENIVNFFVNKVDKLLQKHVSKKHNKNSILSRFNDYRQKISEHTIFDFLNTETEHSVESTTLKYGVEEDDVEGSEHNSSNSVVVYKDVISNATVVSTSDANPGVVFAAISSPICKFDDNWSKAQIASVIKNTEYYDYFYKSTVNAAGSTVLQDMLNLNHLPFIYRLNSDSTWDLWINIPSTMTPYLNRIEGTNANIRGGRARIEPSNSGYRKNVNNMVIPSDIASSATKVRLYIDLGHFNIGSFRQVEICGSSLPMYVYRDSAINDGLFDGVSLQSPWNRKVEEVEDSSGTHYAMIEFKVWGTDEQSIHLSGKTGSEA